MHTPCRPGAGGRTSGIGSAAVRAEGLLYGLQSGLSSLQDRRRADGLAAASRLAGPLHPGPPGVPRGALAMRGGRPRERRRSATTEPPPHTSA